MNAGSLVVVLYLFLPAGAANIAPVLLTHFFGPGTAVRARWFGDHKTWQGLIGGTLAGTAVFLGQILIATFLMPDFGAIDYASAPISLGVAMSAGALLGDMAKSFAKRRFAISPGTPWLPWDEVDFILGALLCSSPWVSLSIPMIAATIVVYVALDLMISTIGFRMHLKARPI